MTQSDPINAIARRAEAERLLRAFYRRRIPWLQSWTIEEVVQRKLDTDFGPDVDPKTANDRLDRLRRFAEVVEPEHFGRWLQQAIEHHGWSQSELARRIDSHPSLVSKWIRGMQLPQPRQCERLARAFKIPPDPVLEAAGHIARGSAQYVSVFDTLFKSPIREEIVSVLDEIPEPLLAPIAAMLRALADPDVANPLLAQVSESLVRINAFDTHAKSKQEDDP